MLTQMDLISLFLHQSSHLQPILSRTVTDLSVLALTSQARVMDAIQCMSMAMLNAIPRTPFFPQGQERELVTCHVTTSLAQVIQMVTAKRVHRVWVVDQNNVLQGLVSLTDIIAAVRSALISPAHYL
ncbi:unnamed protein product [Microthlaspi erraticum]|uniref:CBS domain-containing protein n=1 Tax=Microthlaspi erraticum TaxID=1685480 RepID=A0A6D2IIQ6_9BRAS|nr:unnamed protein product [Microthlaspi erraticum]